MRESPPSPFGFAAFSPFLNLTSVLPHSQPIGGLFAVPPLLIKITFSFLFSFLLVLLVLGGSPSLHSTCESGCNNGVSPTLSPLPITSDFMLLSPSPSAR